MTEISTKKNTFPSVNKCFFSGRNFYYGVALMRNTTGTRSKIKQKVNKTPLVFISLLIYEKKTFFSSMPRRPKRLLFLSFFNLLKEKCVFW